MKPKINLILMLLTASITLLFIYGCDEKDGSSKTNNQNRALTSGDKNMYNKLTKQEQQIILHKGTESPFTGEYYNFFEAGTYTCKQCSQALFHSASKFESDCGWPSFDDQIEGAVKWQPDADGMRTEIICNNCGGHLGHIFLNEGFTEKNKRYCVNSLSLNFIPDSTANKAIFAGGCFWGVEYYFKNTPGVISAAVGYTGGDVNNPTYKQVCAGNTGHIEAIEVVFDPNKTDYEKLAKLFFEIHDFTQLNRQGPDVGYQYRSAVFYANDQQKQIAEKLINSLKQKGYDVKTDLLAAKKFWPAEDYHQDYYGKNGKTPYCHAYKKIFD